MGALPRRPWPCRLPTVWEDVGGLVDDELAETEIRTPEGITEEGIAGYFYFTYGLNANVALSVQAGTNPLPSRGG